MEKQLLAIFPKARLIEQENDYNIFNPDGVSVGAAARLEDYPALPLKTYEQFDHDPLNILIGGFSKLVRDEESRAVSG